MIQTELCLFVLCVLYHLLSLGVHFLLLKTYFIFGPTFLLPCFVLPFIILFSPSSLSLSLYYHLFFLPSILRSKSFSLYPQLSFYCGASFLFSSHLLLPTICPLSVPFLHISVHSSSPPHLHLPRAIPPLSSLFFPFIPSSSLCIPDVEAWLFAFPDVLGYFLHAARHK